MAGDTYKDKFNASVINIAADPKKYHPVATNHFTVTFKLPEGLINQADPKKRTIRESGLDPILALKIANQDVLQTLMSLLNNQLTIFFIRGSWRQAIILLVKLVTQKIIGQKWISM